jgi:GYD domain
MESMKRFTWRSSCSGRPCPPRGSRGFSPRAARPGARWCRTRSRLSAERFEAFYFAFGDDDVVGICELPDNETAAAFGLETSSSGRVSVATTVLITPEEVDRAREKKSGWRAPGA